MKHYRCYRCFYDFVAGNGPVDCPNCGFIYIKDVDVNVTYEDQKKKDEKVDELPVQTRPIDCIDLAGVDDMPCTRCLRIY